MGFSCGIIGLPNVGKSTLFNALCDNAHAEAANYPFCTIEPNKAKVAVPDDRLYKIAELAHSTKIIPTQIEFTDIAGLVKGANEGEGLGNQFLLHIRQVDAIFHVIRCFSDKNITHVEGNVDPLRDLEIIETELMLSDLESVNKRITNISKKIQSGDKSLKHELQLLEKAREKLDKGEFANDISFDFNDLKILNLITSKPMIYICNVDEESALEGNELSQKINELSLQKKVTSLTISSKIEAEISSLSDPQERLLFLNDIGLKETGLSKIIKSGYNLLDLISFFTAGEKESRAWTVRGGATAPEAAGIIHSDFERGFICAETIAYNDYIKYMGESKAKEAGKVRLEGKDYKVQDGDIFHFRFNV